MTRTSASFSFGAELDKVLLDLGHFTQRGFFFIIQLRKPTSLNEICRYLNSVTGNHPKTQDVTHVNFQSPPYYPISDAYLKTLLEA